MSKKKQKFSLNEVRAYWVGVGINAERYGDSDKVLENSNIKIRNSAVVGFNDEGTRGVVQNKFCRKKKQSAKKPRSCRKKKQSAKKKSFNKRVCKEDFSRSDTGRIRGSYTVDGFFEPD